jgi:hypothetical protein
MVQVLGRDLVVALLYRLLVKTAHSVVLSFVLQLTQMIIVRARVVVVVRDRVQFFIVVLIRGRLVLILLVLLLHVRTLVRLGVLLLLAWVKIPVLLLGIGSR